MFAKTAAVLVAITCFATSAHAVGPHGWPNGVSANGLDLNGLPLNGTALNGQATQGIYPNGIWFNGCLFNGTKMNGALPAATGFAIDAIELPAAER